MANYGDGNYGDSTYGGAPPSSWKVLSMLQAKADLAAGTPLHASFPGGAYRVRFLHNQSAANLEAYCTDLVTAGRYVVPYIETEGTYVGHDENGVLDPLKVTVTDAVWAAEMEDFATALANAGVQYIEFGNEPNRPSIAADRTRLWNSYIARLKLSSPIFRKAGVGVMLAGIGPSQYTDGFFNHMHGGGAFDCVDAVAIHVYSGGNHQDGTAAGGLPADTQQKVEDARASLSLRAPGRPELDFFLTELGWPSYWAATPGDQPGITDGGTGTPGTGGYTGHQTYSTTAQQETRAGDVYQRLYDVAQDNRIRVAGWFHSQDYRDGTTPEHAVLASDYTWPGSGTMTVTLQPGFTGNPTDAFVDPANGAAGNAKLTNGTQIITFTGKTATTVTGVAGGTGTWPAGTEIVGDTEGNWAHHHGIKYEPGTPKYIAVGNQGKKLSYAKFDDPLESDYIGIGRNTSGSGPTLASVVVDAIDLDTATINATINPNGTNTQWRLQWGQAELLDTYESIHDIGAGSSPVAVEEVLTGLDDGTEYFFRITAWNDKDHVWSPTIDSFTTDLLIPPGVATDSTGMLGSGSLGSLVLAGESDSAPVIPPDPPTPTFLRKLYRNPALPQAIYIKTERLELQLQAGGGDKEVSAAEAELFLLFEVEGQRIYSYEPWT